MNCQRCLREAKAQYRAYSDVISVEVCSACAAEAWGLGLSIAALEGAQQSKAGRSAYLVNDSAR